MSRNKKQVVKQATEVHRQNIQKSLQHRLDVARVNGDETLIRQLEAEMKYFN
jgi:hypothetical protein